MTLFHSASPPLVTPPDNVTVSQFMLDNEGNHPTRPEVSMKKMCLIEESTGVTRHLDELRTRTDALARSLHATWGLGKNDIVGMYIPNHIDYPVTIWAAHRLGAIISMMSPTLTMSELVYQLTIAKPAVLIAHVENFKVALEAATSIGLPRSRVIVVDAHRSIEPLPVKSLEETIQAGFSYPPIKEFRLAPGEGKKQIAILCFSSGTTGQPKAVAVSHHNLLCSITQTATHFGLNDPNLPVEHRKFRPGDRVLAVLPFYHIYGLVGNLHYSLFGGMSVISMQKFAYENLLKTIERYRITHLFLVPPMVVLFCKHPLTRKFDLSSVHCVVVAAAPLSAELTAQMQELFPNTHLGQGYGLTETCAGVTLFPPEQRVGTLGSAGRLTAGTVAKVVKSDGTLARAGEPGELCVQGGQVTLGYYGNEEATKASFKDGWFHTGDEVIFHENGDIFITDRIKELIKVKGHQVAPAELEGHLLGHPHVADAGVIGVPDDYAGELPFAYIVLQPGIASRVQKDPSYAATVRAEIFKHVTDAKSDEKKLAGGIEFIDAIPKNASGKILRRMLRERAKAKKPVQARLQTTFGPVSW